MDFRKMFNAYEEKIPEIAEAEKAEKLFEDIFDRVAAYDKELAFEMDDVVGMIARSYEMKGFNGALLAEGGAI